MWLNLGGQSRKIQLPIRIRGYQNHTFGVGLPVPIESSPIPSNRHIRYAIERAHFENIDDYHKVPQAVAPEAGSRLKLNHVGTGVVQITEITSSKFDFSKGVFEAKLAEIADDNLGPITIRRNTFIDSRDAAVNMGVPSICSEDHWFESPEDIEGGRPYCKSVSIEERTFYGDTGCAVVVKR